MRNAAGGPNSTVVHQYSFKVLGRETITVPAGTFETYKVNVTIILDGGSRITQLRWYAPLACAEAKAVIVNHDDANNVDMTTTTVLQSFRCAHPWPAVPASYTRTA